MDKSAKKYVLLSFDVEEFDIPLEYGLSISEEEQFEVSKQGLLTIIDLLDNLNIHATFFTTATFASNHKQLIKKIAVKHEIASHGFDHKPPAYKGITNSKNVLEEVTSASVVGFRAPRLQQPEGASLSSAGFTYNSSENPIYLPGRYNNFFKPRTTYISEHNILNVPISASPIFRIPLFWLAFKNLPLPLIKLISRWTLSYDKYLNIFYHPWEFADLSSYPLPKIIKRIHHNAMLERLEKYLTFLKSLSVSFITMKEFENIARQKLQK